MEIMNNTVIPRLVQRLRQYTVIPRLVRGICAVLLIASCSPKPAAEEIPDLAAYVNPKIGTGGHGHVFVGANVPFGMVQLGPTSITQAWDWCSGYHDSENSVIGFSHTHLSGTGCGDLFDITLMPVTGPTKGARTSGGAPGTAATAAGTSRTRRRTCAADWC